jgi:hypothetical protein
MRFRVQVQVQGISDCPSCIVLNHFTVRSFSRTFILCTCWEQIQMMHAFTCWPQQLQGNVRKLNHIQGTQNLLNKCILVLGSVAFISSCNEKSGDSQEDGTFVIWRLLLHSFFLHKILLSLLLLLLLFDVLVLQITYVDFWIYLPKTLSPLRTFSVLGKVTTLIIILCKFHIVHLGYVSFVP